MAGTDDSRRIRAALTQVQGTDETILEMGPEARITLAPGLTISGNDADGYTIALLGDDGSAVSQFTKVRAAPGDVTLLFLPGSSQPFLLQSDGGGGGSNTVQFIEGSQSHFLTG